MTGFIYKNLEASKTVAELLREKRENLGISLEDASINTKACLKYLEALENGDYQKIPGLVYQKLWLKKYAHYLGLNTADVLREFDKEINLQQSLPDPLAVKKLINQKKNLVKFSPKLFRNLSLGLIIVVLVFYLGWEVKKIIDPPILKIYEPTNLITTAENKIKIKGLSEPEISLWINNQQILTSAQGLFEEEVELTPGMNNFQIIAKKKNSRKNIINLSIIKNSDSGTKNDLTQNNLGLN